MDNSNMNEYVFPVQIPEESRLQLVRGREKWVRIQVKLHMEDWQRWNPAPGFNDHPMAIDRYEEVYRREAEKSERYWCYKFDKEVLPKGLEHFLKMLEADDEKM